MSALRILKCINKERENAKERGWPFMKEDLLGNTHVVSPQRTFCFFGFRMHAVFTTCYYRTSEKEKKYASYTQFPDAHVHPAVSVRSNTPNASAAFTSSSSLLPSSSSLAHRHASTAACTSLKLLIPTTTGIRPSDSPSQALLTDHATATFATSASPTTLTTSLAASRTALGAGCHAGGAGGGARRPIPSGEAAKTCDTRARVRNARAKAGSVAFCSVRCA
jgi:hypothetical protein